MKRVCIIFNPKSGVTNRKDEIAQYCQTYPSGDFEILFKELVEGENIGEVAKRYLNEGYETLVAAGGDGTVSAVAGALVGTSGRLGIIPLGTLNHLARDLEIPMDLRSALDLIFINEKEERIDAASCNGQIFINNSSLGIYPEIVKMRDKLHEKTQWRLAAHIIATWKTLSKLPKVNASIELENKKILRHTSFIFIGNNAYELTGVNLGRRRTLSRGRLSLWVPHAPSIFGLFGLVLSVIGGRLDEEKDLEVFHPRVIEVRTVPILPDVSFDGEVKKMQSPLLYEILPQSLKVIVSPEEKT